jgi:hypothetical protein
MRHPNLANLSHDRQVSAILTASPEAIHSAASKLRRSKGGGAAKVVRPCPKCGQPFGAREMRKHVPTCK